VAESSLPVRVRIPLTAIGALLIRVVLRSRTRLRGTTVLPCVVCDAPRTRCKPAFTVGAPESGALDYRPRISQPPCQLIFDTSPSKKDRLPAMGEIEFSKEEVNHPSLL